MKGMADQSKKATSLLKLFGPAMALSPRLGNAKHYTVSLPRLFFMKHLQAIKEALVAGSADSADSAIVQTARAFNVEVWHTFASVASLEDPDPHELLVMARDDGLKALTDKEREERVLLDSVTELAMYLDPAVTASTLINCGIDRSACLAFGVSVLLSQVDQGSSPSQAAAPAVDETIEIDDAADVHMQYDSDGNEYSVAAGAAGSGAAGAGAGAGAGAAAAAAGAASAGDKRKRVAADKTKAPSGSNFVSKQKQAELDAAAAAVVKKAEEKEQRRLAYTADLTALKEKNPRGEFEALAAFQARFAVLVAALKARHRLGEEAPPPPSPLASTEQHIYDKLVQEANALDKLRADPKFSYGDPFAPCPGHVEVVARYRFWPSQKESMPLLYALASSVLAGGCGPATSISNESLQAIAKVVSSAQRSSASVIYINDAALSRATLPTIIAAVPSLNDLAARADVDGFLNEEEVLNIVAAEGI